MLSVFICEDDPIQRLKMEKIIENYIMIEEFDMQIILSTANPDKVIGYLNAHSDTRGIYFLDVDLGQEMNGIQLGATIRELDINGKIVFITTHSELLTLTFQYKVEAMDYILKDDSDRIQQRVYEALIQAQRHYLADSSGQQDMLRLKIGSQIRVFSLKSVMFIETSATPHKLVLHLDNSSIEFYGKINEIENLATPFFRAHKSYVVNTENIETINKSRKEINLINGETILVSVRQLRKLEAMVLTK